MIAVTECIPAALWESLYFESNIDSCIGEVHMVGAGGSSVTLGLSILEVAKCTWIANNGASGISLIKTQIVEIVYKSTSNVITRILNTKVVAGNGYKQIGGTKIFAKKKKKGTNKYSEILLFLCIFL